MKRSKETSQKNVANKVFILDPSFHNDENKNRNINLFKKNNAKVLPKNNIGNVSSKINDLSQNNNSLSYENIKSKKTIVHNKNIIYREHILDESFWCKDSQNKIVHTHLDDTAVSPKINEYDLNKDKNTLVYKNIKSKSKNEQNKKFTYREHNLDNSFWSKNSQNKIVHTLDLSPKMNDFNVRLDKRSYNNKKNSQSEDLKLFTTLQIEKTQIKLPLINENNTKKISSSTDDKNFT